MEPQVLFTPREQPFSVAAFDISKDSSCSNLCVEELINKRAYDLYEKSGRIEDRGIENWINAEREVKHHLGI